MAVQPLLSSLSSELTAGYLDDFSLGGPEQVVARDVDTVITEGSKLGLHLNFDKCELFQHGGYQVQSSILNSFIPVHKQDAALLGAPLFCVSALDEALADSCLELSSAIERLNTIEAHYALVLLRCSFSAPKIQYLLRCSPCVGHASLGEFDSLLRAGISRITNSNLSDSQWLQASLPVRNGGLGVRRVSSLALSAFLASAAGTLILQDQVLLGSNSAPDSFVTVFQSVWTDTYSQPLPDQPASSKQSTWDERAIQADIDTAWNSAADNYNRARLTAVSAPHSGDWLHVRPISACGLKLDNEAIRVAVGLRLGVSLCHPHDCPCGELVDATGIHGLSCKLAFGRMTRHHLVNDI